MRRSIHNTPSALLALLLLAAVAAFACAPAEEPAQEPAEPAVEPAAEPVAAPMVATATLVPAEDAKMTGTATFSQQGDQVTLTVEVEGAPAGMHGFHVHEAGVCEPPDYTSAGGHFNPAGVDHACPPATPRHAGDFGNIEVGEDGTGMLEITVGTDQVTVAEGALSVLGKAVILHAGEDDCTSQPTGAAGGRLACGVIELAGAEPAAAADAATEGEEGDGY